MNTEIIHWVNAAANRVASAKSNDGILARLTAPAPDRFVRSMRIPVTRANRAYLRILRAAELEAWQRTERSK